MHMSCQNWLELRNFRSKHLIKPIAAYQRSGDRCLVFPWADGGNLYEFWGTYKGDPLADTKLRWVTLQLTGLFSALEDLDKENCRHGDLKPENILLFLNEDKSMTPQIPESMTLQIADLGLSTFHKKDALTRIRRAANLATETPPGTSRYEPPEEDKNRSKKPNSWETRSRAYDVWSIGCVVLELLIWLTYGYKAVDEFRNETKYLWEKVGGRYRIQHRAQEHIDNISRRWPQGSICGDLVRFVKTSLLVVAMPDETITTSQCRATAPKAHTKMKNIQRKYHPAKRLLPTLRALDPCQRGQSGRIWWAGRNTAQGDGGSGAGLAVNTCVEQSVLCGYETQGSNKLNDHWDSLSDNAFASQMFNHVNWPQIRPLRTEENSKLCANCSITTSTMYSLSERQLSTMQRSCELCVLLLDSLSRAGITSPAVVKLLQTGTAIGLEGGPNLLSIYAEPGHDVPAGRQIGFPLLPEPNSQEQLLLLKHWIQSCDSEHHACHRHDGQATSEMPTRLVKVTDPVQLLNSCKIEPSRYIALSHCWGQLQEHERFCLNQRNHNQLEERIDFNLLPKTFRDAITVTRGLGIEYIWIDTLCIIQDDGDDWEKESSKMETVFSAAYCTLSAASAESSLDGFLSPRQPRPCVRLQTEDSRQLYACPHIDDFRGDVELAKINRRGWVLQERALSRRSIYYSRTQVYWECGEGIRCETMGRLYNSKAAFLGDANFPRSALEYYRDGRQLLIQDLYERYSALAFTKASDRAVAILGLQERLARAFKTQAAHGTFESYFARSILWRRDHHLVEMTPIAQPAGRRVPSWSWFSKSGRIQYMNLTFEKTKWMNDDFRSPFTSQSDNTVPGQISRPACPDTSSILRGFARRMEMDEGTLASQVVFDMKNTHEAKDFRAVQIGRDKDEGNSLDAPKVHVLVICKASSDPIDRMYKRVGVASLSPEQVLEEGVWVDIC
ncbi:heterokaryon incompatibility protein [Colletotrichum graminicola M1.001]|uniref:Heterokaryon incompatibility protein n=1 Tax=Colletotrichum graminicola (strain M1.001 / M2 / FGSC 10212) TaxID=645133 RepID=E3QHJ6_COLGM|nr:heterokaryon incompatibility protein [Colletotrichum graminicola M1.001]EFQ30167.1 heterokaryon incompatibility protein [Colletotrichum graminicola M1.001]